MNTDAKLPARRRILDAAVKLVRTKGYNATTVDDLCAEAGTTKGAFFHHFKSKEDLGTAAARHWTDITVPLFEGAPYHAPARPLERVLAYIDFRKSIIRGELAEFTCLAGTLAQEVHTSHPAIAHAAGEAITGHAATLVNDIQAAMDELGKPLSFTAQSLALHTQAVLQGGFILAKSTGDPAHAEETIAHLRRYFEMTFRKSGGRDSAYPANNGTIEGDKS
jgi:TetR/AcrR family transcriptional regulator, transcriptional repressor for nem operon